MIDTHAHLNFPELSAQIDKVVQESKDAGLEAIIIASSNISDSKKAIELARKYPDFLWACVGIHPQKTDPENKTSIQKQLDELEELICSVPKGIIAAIGECGMDFSEPPPREEERSKEDQEKLLIGQTVLSLKHNLPLIIHARQANDEVIGFYNNFNQKNPLSSKKMQGVFHCYSGGKKRIPSILGLSGKWYFGVDGNITYSLGLQNVVSLIPKERLLLETDAPFLAPVPHRGEINTPAYLPLIAQQIAKIWNVPVEEVIDQTTKNAKELFSSE